METPPCKWLLALGVLTSMVLGCHGARILAIFPDTSLSHTLAYQPLTRALASRGHHITVISYFQQSQTVPNYRDITIEHQWFGIDKFLGSLLNEKDSRENAMAAFEESEVGKCRLILGNPEVQKLIHSESEHFDLLILELLTYECFLGFAHKYNTSVIGIYGNSGMVGGYDLVGNTSPPSFVPDQSELFSDRMSMTERVRNAHAFRKIREMTENEIPMFDGVIWEYFNHLGPIPSITELQKRFSFIFLNNDLSLSLPRPLLPNVKNIAGMHLQPAKGLPKDIKKMLDEAEDGVILFSMGTHVGEFMNSTDTLRSVVNAFSKLKQLVLWKRIEEIPGLSANVKLLSWLPQADVLAHPNVQLFITHGGMLSLEEAVYHAKPIVGIPVYGDQFFNVHRAQQLGFGVLLDYNNLTSDALVWAVETATSQSSYLESVKRVSVMFRDQPIPPLEKAVFWTEYVIRHKGAPHLRCAALDLAWYQYLLLDVVGVLALGALLVALALYKTTRLVAALMFKRLRTAKIVKKESGCYG